MGLIQSLFLSVDEHSSSEISFSPLPLPHPCSAEGCHPEYQYIDLVREIIDHGEERQDRTGMGTRTIFAPPQLRFNLSEGFPLLTTKRVSFRLVAEELLWFIR